jgi:hypothetical protein
LSARPGDRRRSLETFLGARPANDLVALAEAEPSLLEPERLPELLQPLVEGLDLVLDGRIEAVGQAVPEVLAGLRELLDLFVYLVRGHVVWKRVVAGSNSPAEER